MNPGDCVTLRVGSWIDGEFVPDHREVEGKVYRVGRVVGVDEPVAEVSTAHGMRKNGTSHLMLVQRRLSDLKPINNPKED